MAMTPAGMADAIYAEMEKEYWPGIVLPPQAETETKRYYTILAKAIIDYVKANCDVLPDDFVSEPGSFHIPNVGNVVGQGAITGKGKLI